MSIKEQVIEIIDSVHPDEAIAGVSIEFVRWLKHKIQAIPDEVTLREVKEYCSKTSCGDCFFDSFICEFDTSTPYDWDIDLITKAIRGSK
jgi:hypothetical protein